MPENDSEFQPADALENGLSEYEDGDQNTALAPRRVMDEYYSEDASEPPRSSLEIRVNDLPEFVELAPEEPQKKARRDARIPPDDLPQPPSDAELELLSQEMFPVRTAAALENDPDSLVSEQLSCMTFSAPDQMIIPGEKVRRESADQNQIDVEEQVTGFLVEEAKTPLTDFTFGINPDQERRTYRQGHFPASLLMYDFPRPTFLNAGYAWAGAAAEAPSREGKKPEASRVQSISLTPLETIILTTLGLLVLYWLSGLWGAHLKFAPGTATPTSIPSNTAQAVVLTATLEPTGTILVVNTSQPQEPTTPPTITETLVYHPTTTLIQTLTETPPRPDQLYATQTAAVLTKIVMSWSVTKTEAVKNLQK